MLDAHISHIHSVRVFEHFQKASVGEHVTLPCRVVGKRGVLQWTRDDFGLGNDRDLTGFRRYTMTGSDEEGKEEKGIPNKLSMYNMKKCNIALRKSRLSNSALRRSVMPPRAW